MIDNFYDIHECNGLSCSSYCQTLSNIVVLKNKGLGTFYLTTIVTMIDNFINHEYNGLSCFSYCQSLSNIVVIKNKRLDNFVFNDNSDND